jgi:ketosteroid isomerase-like protein
MASANVELVRSICAAWERGDYSSVAWADPEIEFVIADGPEPGRWTGLAGMSKGFRGFLSAWSGHRAVAEQIRELDDGRVLVLVHVVARGKASEMELGQMHAQGASMFSVRDAKVTRLACYFDHARALPDSDRPRPSRRPGPGR